MTVVDELAESNVVTITHKASGQVSVKQNVCVVDQSGNTPCT